MDSLSLLERGSKTDQPITVVPIPFVGGSDAAGMEKTPEALFDAGLLEAFEKNGWQTTVAEPIVTNTPYTPQSSVPPIDSGFQSVIQQAFTVTRRVLSQNERVLAVGGDHSIALGTISAALAQFPDLGVIWIDAHGDINTQASSLSHNVHGMVVSFLLHEDIDHPFSHYPTLSTDRLLFLGIKDLDQAEIDLIRSRNIAHVTSADLLVHGHGKLFRALEELSKRCKHIWVSFDIDSVHMDAAPAASMSTLSGFRHREITTICRFIGKSMNVVGVDFVEMVPSKDVDQLTAQLAVETITSLFGGTYDWYDHYMAEYGS